MEAVEQDEVITLKEMIEEQEKAIALMGSTSSSVCTFPQGYLKRQPVFTCLTCTPADGEIKAGICLACSLNCHDKHDILELYTKRDFRCDCGTLPQVFCNIDQNDKDVRNPLNTYNQNFSGSYCVCHRPYPDDAPDANQSEMVQCSCCEDWYHTDHLLHEKDREAPVDFDELICHVCIAKHPFLAVYAMPLPETVRMVTKDEAKPIDVELVTTVEAVEQPQGKEEQKPGMSEHPKPLLEDEPASKRQRVHQSGCIHDTSPFTDEPISTCYYNLSYREKLCKCSDCVTLFEEHKITFLRSTADSLVTYENENLAEAKTEEESFASSLESLPHAQKCEVARCIGDIKSAITSLFEGKAEGGILTRDDVMAAFAGLKEKNAQG